MTTDPATTTPATMTSATMTSAIMTSATMTSANTDPASGAKRWRGRRRIGLLAGVMAMVLFTTAGACGPSEDDEAREAAAESKAKGPTLEKENLERKRKIEEDPNAVGYVYLMSYGEFIGYWVTRGKISSNGSQATPEQDIHWTCRSSHGCQPVVVDGPQDDGSFGGHDPGIFFFLADGTKVVTNIDYVQTDRPLAGINVPKLGGTA